MDSNKLRIVTPTPHNLSAGTVIRLDFHDQDGNPGTPDPFTNPSSTTYSVAQVVNSTNLVVNATGIVSTTYSQAAGSNVLTVNVSGPQTDVAVSGTATTIKSRVFLKFLTQTASGAAIPADAVYDVQSNAGGNFTAITADTPAQARGGSILVPRYQSSYTPQSSNTIVLFSTNFNHNLQVGHNVWVDLPPLVTPLTDAEYTITVVGDEDHFTTSYLPANLNGGTYPNPIGAHTGGTLWPLVTPPLGRSGTVKVNQSTFLCNGTDGTLSQTPLNAPTVFNYYFPDYKFPGSLANAGLDSPEFQLSTDTGIVNLTNSVVNMFIGTTNGNSNPLGLSSFESGGGAIAFDVGEFMTPAQTANAGIPALIDNISNRLVGGPPSPGVKAQIQTLVANTGTFPLSSPTPTTVQMRNRVHAIIHLIVSSGEYAIQK